ncbi:MAG: type VI secretion system tube protein Hcp [Bryobacterales bacterium]|nr:type VI secretion system tube protein Hcp [Bryobacterales bacterium]
MPIYMKFEGAKPAVPGSGKSAQYAKWVEVNSFQKLGATYVGRGGGIGQERSGGSRGPKEAVFSLPMNASAQALWTNAVEGTSMTVLVDFLEKEGKPSDLYLSLVLTGAQVSAFSVSGGGAGGAGIGLASLLYEDLKMEYRGKSATP